MQSHFISSFEGLNVDICGHKRSVDSLFFHQALQTIYNDSTANTNIDHLEKFALPDLKDIIRFDFVFDISHVTLECVDEQEAIL